MAYNDPYLDGPEELEFYFTMDNPFDSVLGSAGILWDELKPGEYRVRLLNEGVIYCSSTNTPRASTWDE